MNFFPFQVARREFERLLQRVFSSSVEGWIRSLPRTAGESNRKLVVSGALFRLGSDHPVGVQNAPFSRRDDRVRAAAFGECHAGKRGYEQDCNSIHKILELSECC